MRVLILHSRYRSGHASGENSVVDDEARLLASGGHHVSLLAVSPTAVSGAGVVGTAAGAVWSPRAVARVSRKIRETGAEIVHCHNLFPTLSPAVLRASAERGAAPVMTLHNYRLMCLPSTFLRDGRVCEDCMGRPPWPGVLHHCYRGSMPGSAALAASLSTHRMFRTFDRVALYLPVSEFVRRKYIEGGFAPDRLRTKSNFTWPAPRRAGAGDHFLFLGRLSSEKGLQTLLEGWSRTSARLLVVGDGPDADRLRSDAPDNVEFVGSVPRGEVEGYVRGARAVLLPSRWYEAQPRVVLEAYASGVAVLASRIGALPELVADDTSGLLVPPDDALAWIRAVERLRDDAESVRLGEGAYRLWRERYSPDRGLENLEMAYRLARSAYLA
jgi:glycosyltransferase involved in cell wall biosynthesis